MCGAIFSCICCMRTVRAWCYPKDHLGYNCTSEQKTTTRVYEPEIWISIFDLESTCAFSFQNESWIFFSQSQELKKGRRHTFRAHKVTLAFPCLCVLSIDSRYYSFLFFWQLFPNRNWLLPREPNHEEIDGGFVIAVVYF